VRRPFTVALSASLRVGVVPGPAGKNSRALEHVFGVSLARHQSQPYLRTHVRSNRHSTSRRRKLSVVVDRHLFMDARIGNFQEVSPMSTMTASHDFNFGPARRTTARSAVAVRLTRRGRLALLALFVMAAFVALTVLGGQSAATGEPGVPVETRTVMVGEGDTLWAIASDVAESGEVREMIHRIQELNALTSASLSRGQELAVPVG
jgi:LysM repeat protein